MVTVFKYFINIRNIDNTLIIYIGANGDMNKVFPRDGMDEAYFDNDKPLNITFEITNQLQFAIPNKVRFECWNGKPVPAGNKNPVHMKYKIYFERFVDNVLAETGSITAGDLDGYKNVYGDDRAPNSLQLVDQWTITKQKDGSFNFELDGQS